MPTVDYDWTTTENGETIVTDMTEDISDMVEQYEKEIKEQKESSYWNPENFVVRRAELDEMGM